MTRGSLRLRLLLAGALSIVAALVLAGFALSWLFERHVERRAVAELTAHMNQIVAGLGRDDQGALVLARTPADPRFERPLSGLYWQLEAPSLLLRSRSLWDTRLALPEDALADGQVHEHRIDGPANQRLLAVERSVRLPARLGGEPVRVATALALADISAATQAFAADSLPYLLLLGALLLAASGAQVVIGLRPLATIRRRIGDIRAGKAQRLGTGFPREVGPLAAEVDALLEAREAQLAAARARAADLAHGLKTPLQVLAGDVARLRETGADALAEDIENVAQAMRRHVERELARARAASGSSDAWTPVSIAVDRVLAVLRRTPDGARLEWKVEAAPDIEVRIDTDDLTEALGNLVENAARHARSLVHIEARDEGAMLRLAVRDDGPGIAPGQLQQMPRRGARLDTTPSGAGLGLAIAQDIAEAWGGRLELEAAQGGLSATLVLPGRRVR